MLTGLQRMYKQQECVGTKPRLRQREGRQFAGRRDAARRRLLKAGKLSGNRAKQRRRKTSLPIFTCHLFEVEKTITYRIPRRPSYFNYIVTETPPSFSHPFPQPLPFTNTHEMASRYTLARVPAPHHRVITQPGRKRLFLGSVNV